MKKYFILALCLTVWGCGPAKDADTPDHYIRDLDGLCAGAEGIVVCDRGRVYAMCVWGDTADAWRFDGQGVIRAIEDRDRLTQAEAVYSLYLMNGLERTPWGPWRPLDGCLRCRARDREVNGMEIDFEGCR